MYAIILCGGSGTRLWPLSRKNFPKQFLSLYSEKSLLQETFLRMGEILPRENIFFVTNQENYFNVSNQIKDIYADFSPKQIIIEPVSLNTAPAITLAIKYLADIIKINPQEPIISLHSDAHINDRENFLRVVKTALAQTKNNIGTIGITPAGAETGYGYIRKAPQKPQSSLSYHNVLEFKEKPDKKTAEQYILSGEYLWNSGMFIFNIKTMAHEIRKHASEIYAKLTYNFDDFLKSFKTLPNIAIDYAVLEKCGRVIVFEGDFGWSDIGSFDSLADIENSSKEETEKKQQKNNRHIGVDSKNIFVRSSSNRLVATVGVDDLNIIESSDSILIQKKGCGEDVKKIVQKLKKSRAKELNHNLIVYRPWGKYEILIDSPRHKVKKIIVYPRARLSLQLHYHRAEHWIIVRGIAKIVNGEKESLLKENESAFIPANTIHRLENPGKVDLELIEVQTGDYLGEDDIIRYEDIYNRK